MVLRTLEEVVAYARSKLRAAQMQMPTFVLPVDPAAPDLVATEIGDGNLNFSWRVSEAGAAARAVFIKQAPGYIKCLGEGYELGAERMLIESDVMLAYMVAAPALVPKLLVRDTDNFAMVTEFLHEYTLMRTALRNGGCGVQAARDVARFMALTHLHTWGSSRWEQVSNEAMCGITAEFVFSKPFLADEPTNRNSEGVAAAATALRSDTLAVNAVAELRAIFLGRKECLVHGDLHTGSVMVPVEVTGGGDVVGGTATAKVIDAEFAHFGCAAFDVGTFLANLLFASIACPDASARLHVEGMLKATWETYSLTVSQAPSSPMPSAATQSEQLSLATGFAGCELIRRVIGAAHVDDIELLTPPSRKLQAERAALAIGRALVTCHGSLRSVDALLFCAHEAVDTISA